jgi:hypothetical protein
MATDSVIMTADVGEVVPAEGATSRVVVTAPYQVCHDGIVYGPNEVAEVPENAAAHWLTNGWVVANGSAK